jgi:hypothetical protein
MSHIKRALLNCKKAEKKSTEEYLKAQEEFSRVYRGSKPKKKK